ncbi:MAG: ABC transporter permease [Prevotella sp.]|nr:ABC transporter permease [Staphylococcus sp.]MCM1350297.1 ABC transporter permease [Prevotella sp.]
MVKQSVLRIKVGREIKSNWKQYLSVVFIACLAVTLFTGILANYRNFENQLVQIYQSSHMCDAIIMTKTYDERLENILQKEDVKYEKRIYFTFSYENHPVYVIVHPDSSNMNLPYSVEKEKNVQKGIFVDESFLTRNQLKVGDTFEVALPMGLTITLQIQGTMIHPESLEHTSYNPSLLYMDQSSLVDAILTQYSFLSKDIIENYLSTYFNQYLVEGSNIQSILNDIKDQFSDSDQFVYALETKDLPSNQAIESDVIQAKQLIYIFPVIFYLVAILIILTSISQLIQREQKNIGILKALGYAKYQILYHYTSIFLVLGGIGSLLGIILGPLIIPYVMGMKYQMLYQLPKVEMPFFRMEYLISVVVLLMIIVITSLLACHSSLTKVPAISLRGENAVHLKRGILSKISWIKRMPLNIIMAFRNMRRKWSRTCMVIIGVLGCSSLLVCGFGIEDTIYYGLDLELETYIPYDVTVNYLDNASYQSQFFCIEGIQSVDEYAKHTVNIEKDNIIHSNLYILPEESSVFQIAYNHSSCLISSKVAEEIGCKEQDTIRFWYDNQVYEVVVARIVDFCISQGIFISQYCFDELPFLPTGAWIQTTDSSYNEIVSNQISQMEGILSAVSIETTREKVNHTIGSIQVMTLTIKIFAILLAVVVLYNLALLNFKERTKDIATLKVLGFSRTEIGSSFMIEIMFLTCIGALIGLFFGKPLLIEVLSINENPLLSYIYYIRPQSYIWTICLTCGVSFIINLIFAVLTNRVKMVESLKSVE